KQADDAVRYSPGLFDAGLEDAFRPHAGSWMGRISTDGVAVRSEPDMDAERGRVLFNKRPVEVNGIVRGAEVEGTDAWYVVGQNEYISAAYIAPLVLQAPPQVFSGHWVDV